MRTSSASPIFARFPRRSQRSWLRQFVALWFYVICASADGESSATPTKWRGLDAMRLTDGRSEAVVVPALGGRLVHYGLIGGLNWMWCGEPGAETRILRVASAYEAASKRRVPPPMFGPLAGIGTN